MRKASASSPFPETCRRLELVGIDPNTVAIYGFSTRGYRTFDLDKRGHRTRKPGTHHAATTLHRWNIPASTINGIFAAYRKESAA